MKSKLTGNVMWESSRMIIPEHRKAIVEQMNSLKYQEKRELDESELERLSYLFHESLFKGISLSLEIYGLRENEKVEGIIEKIDMQLRRFKIQSIWYAFQDVQKILD